jgi:hypothetical protein
MSVGEIIASLDAEIGRLYEVKALLGGGTRTGNPRAVAKAAGNGGVRPKRIMSADARARISAAQKRRWAKQKAGKKAA